MILDAIYSLLTESTDVTDIVGNNIYPEVAPQGVEMPFIITAISSVTPEATKTAASKLDTYSVKLIMFGNDIDSLMTLNNKVRVKLDRYRGVEASSDIDYINFKGTESGYDNTANVFIVESDYNIREKL